jgi:hypothetical protein
VYVCVYACMRVGMCVLTRVFTRTRSQMFLLCSSVSLTHTHTHTLTLTLSLLDLYLHPCRTEVLLSPMKLINSIRRTKRSSINCSSSPSSLRTTVSSSVGLPAYRIRLFFAHVRVLSVHMGKEATCVPEERASACMYVCVCVCVYVCSDTLIHSDVNPHSNRQSAGLHLNSLGPATQTWMYVPAAMLRVPASASVYVRVCVSTHSIATLFLSLSSLCSLGEPKTVHFPSYSRDQLMRIVQERLNRALRLPNGEVFEVFDTTAVRLCAARVSNVVGDARRALDICAYVS